MLNTNFIKRLPDDVLNTIADAQMADLIERRNIQDEQLFKDCFRRAFDKMFDPDGTEPCVIGKIVENFTDVAGQAFIEYHDTRAKQKEDAEAQAQADVWEETNTEDAEDEEEI